MPVVVPFKNYALIFSIPLFAFCILQSCKSEPKRSAYEKGLLIDSVFEKAAYFREEWPALKLALQDAYRASGDQEYEVAVEFFEHYTKSFIRTNDTPMIRIEQLAERYNDQYPNVAARMWFYLGYEAYLGGKNFEKAFEYYFKTESLLNKVGYPAITKYGGYKIEISNAYYRFKNYRKSIEILRQVARLPNDKMKRNTHAIWTAYDDIGQCYRQLGLLDSSNYYFKIASSRKDLHVHPLSRSIALGNLGYNYYLTKKYDSAIPFLNLDYYWAKEFKDYGLAVGAAVPLADIYIGKGMLAQAKVLLDSSVILTKLQNNIHKNEKLYLTYSRYYGTLGDHFTAAAYKDSAINMIRYNDSAFSNILLIRAQEKDNLQKFAEGKRTFNYYKRKTQQQYAIAITAVVLLVTGIVLYGRYRRRILRAEAKIQELQKVIEIRKKISEDIHDEIGSTLSSISLYSYSLMQQQNDESQKKTLGRINVNAQSIQGSLSDIIWSVNPEMDSFEQILARMRAFGSEIAESKRVTFSFDIADSLPALNLDMLQRKNLYLIYKEAMNNAVKYSDCTMIQSGIHLGMQQNIIMHVKDNGKSFDTSKTYNGNGLSNMRRRAQEMNATLTLSSAAGIGTEIALDFVTLV